MSDRAWRWVWFIALWLGGVGTVLAVGGVIRLFLA